MLGHRPVVHPFAEGVQVKNRAEEHHLEEIGVSLTSTEEGLLIWE